MLNALIDWLIDVTAVAINAASITSQTFCKQQTASPTEPDQAMATLTPTPKRLEAAERFLPEVHHHLLRH